MSPVLNAKVLFEIPMTVGHPLSMCADVMMDNRSFIRIVCANGILVGHPDGVSTVAGEYSEYLFPGRKENQAYIRIGECGVFATADGTIMLLASLSTPGVDVLSIDGGLHATLWPAKQGDTTICVKAVSSHSGFFSNVRRLFELLFLHFLIHFNRDHYYHKSPEPGSKNQPQKKNMARVKGDPKKREEQRRKKEKEQKKSKKSKPQPVEVPAIKKQRRDKDGRKILRKIRQAQRSTENLFPRTAVKRICKEIAGNVSVKGGIRFTPNAISAIQLASEDLLVNGFRDGQHLQCNISEGSKTLKPAAFKAALQLVPGNTVSLPSATAVATAAGYRDESPDPMPTTEVATGNDSE